MKVTVNISNILSKVATVVVLHVANQNLMRSKKVPKKLLQSR